MSTAPFRYHRILPLPLTLVVFSHRIMSPRDDDVQSYDDESFGEESEEDWVEEEHDLLELFDGDEDAVIDYNNVFDLESVGPAPMGTNSTLADKDAVRMCRYFHL